MGQKSSARRGRRFSVAILAVALATGGFVRSRRESPIRRLEKSPVFMPGTPITFDPSPIDARSIKNIKLLGRVGTPWPGSSRVDFSNDRKFATVRDQSSLNVVDLQTGKAIQAIEGNFVSSAVSNDGSKVVAWGNGIWLVDGARRRRLRCDRLPESRPELMFSDDATRFALWGTSEGALGGSSGGCVFDTETLTRKTLPFKDNQLVSTEFFARSSTKDSMSLDYAKTEGRFQWGPHTAESLKFPKPVDWLQASEDQSVVIGTSATQILRWDRSSKQWTESDSDANNLCEKICASAISQDASVLASKDEIGVYLTSTTDGKKLWATDLEGVLQLSVGADHVLAVTLTESLVALDRQTGKVVWRLPQAGTITGATPTQVEFETSAISLATGIGTTPFSDDRSDPTERANFNSFYHAASQVEGVKVSAKRSEKVARPVTIEAFGKTIPSNEKRVVQSIAVHPNMQEFLIGQANGALERFDTQTGRSIGIVENFGEAPIALSYNASGHLVVGFASGMITIYDAKTKRLASWKLRHRVESVALSPDATLVAVGSIRTAKDNNPDERLIELVSAADQATKFANVVKWNRQIAFSPDSKSVVALIGGEIKQFNLSGKEVAKRSTVGWSANIETTPSGFNVFDQNDTIQRFSADLKTSELSTQYVKVWRGEKPYRYVTTPYHVVVEPTGMQPPRNIRTKDADPVVIDGTHQVVSGFEATRDGKTLRALQIFDMATGVARTTPTLRSRDEKWCSLKVHVTPDEQTIHVIGCGGLWVLNSDFSVRKSIDEKGFGLVSEHELAYSPNAGMFALLKYGRVRFFESSTGKQLGSVKVQPTIVGRIKFSTDGSYFVTQSIDDSVAIYGVPPQKGN
jgi:WD40 repeat protein